MRNPINKPAVAGVTLATILLLMPAAANYSFFTPAQTTNVVNGLITAGTFSSGAYNVNQFQVSPYTLVQIKPNATFTNTSLTTPTLSYPVTTGGTITGGTNSGTALLSVTTPGLTGFMYGNGASAVTASTNLTDTGSAISSTLPVLATTGLNVGVGGLIKRIINATNTIDIGLTGVGGGVDTAVTVTGADQVNNNVFCVPLGLYQTGYSLWAWVSATNQVTVRLTNIGLGATDPAAMIFSITVFNL